MKGAEMKQKRLFAEVSRPGRMYLRILTMLILVVLLGITMLICQVEAQGRMLDEHMQATTGLTEAVESIQADAGDDELLGFFKATNYCAGFGDGCPVCGTNGTTATGTKCSPVGNEWVTIAVDPRVIPYGTKLKIVYTDGSITYGIAEDTGGFAASSPYPVNQIDICMANHEEALQAGVDEVKVYITEGE